MPVHKHIHAFQVNKAALTNLPTDFCLILDAFGMQLNMSSIVEGIISNWRHFFHKQWMDFDHLIILSYHKTNGNRLDNATIPNQPEVLLLAIDGVVGDCHMQNIKFVCVQCTINFSALIMIDLYPVTTKMRARYYIDLPQGT
jgi:hypothetical protein